MSDDVIDPETGDLIVSPAEAERGRAAAARLMERIPASRGAVQAQVDHFGDDAGAHNLVGDPLSEHSVALAGARPRDETALTHASAFLEDLAAHPELWDLAKLTATEHVLSCSPTASRLFVAERGGPHARRPAERCAERFSLSLEGLMDPTAPRDAEGRPVRSDPRRRRNPRRH